MEHKHSNASANDYKEVVCAIQCDTLLQEKCSALSKYIEFCSTRLVLPIINFNQKQLQLFGTTASTLEAEKQFLELQNKILFESSKNQISEGVHWWYEAWDATWQLYNPKITIEIEYHYKSKVSNFTILNQFEERVSFDLNKWEEIYGTRIKRIRRSKLDEQQPTYWTLTPLNLERFTLDIKSEEYLSLKENFDQTMAGRYIKLISIERIQNLRLFRQFCASHEDFIVRYGRAENGTMRFLYHGCPELAAKRIFERGFNRSYCGKNGCLYGQGVYFSANANYSDTYATPNETKEKRMFFSRVLIGRSMIGYSGLCEPEDGYDTTTNGTHIFVCYYDSQCYPEYLLTYM